LLSRDNIGPIFEFWSILSALVGVDKTLFIPHACRQFASSKHNEPSQDRHLAATLAGAFS